MRIDANNYVANNDHDNDYDAMVGGNNVEIYMFTITKWILMKYQQSR